MAEKDGEEVQETLYILPPDMLAERWTGKRFTPEEARARSGTAQIASSGEWENRLKLLMRSGRFERIAMICTGTIRRMQIPRVSGWHGNLESGTRQPHSRIFPVRYAASAPSSSRVRSRRCGSSQDYKGRHFGDDEGIKAGMYEYQYKAEFDYALAQHGCLAPAFPSIISAGAIISVFTIMSTQGRRKTAI